LFDRPKPTVGCSASGRRRRREEEEEEGEEEEVIWPSAMRKRTLDHF
jgi:hypothetical protein